MRLIGKILLAILVLAAVLVAITHTRALKAREADQAFHAAIPKSILLHSVSFSAGSEISAAYTCKGEGVSPEVSWEGAPEKTRSYVLIATDWDAPSPNFRLGSFTHWILYNIGSQLHQVKSAAKPEELSGEKIDVGNNSSDVATYMPPCPPLGKHRYLFRLYALDVPEIRPASHNRDGVMEAMKGHILAFGEISGLFGG